MASAYAIAHDEHLIIMVRKWEGRSYGNPIIVETGEQQAYTSTQVQDLIDSYNSAPFIIHDVLCMDGTQLKAMSIAEDFHTEPTFDPVIGGVYNALQAAE